MRLCCYVLLLAVLTATLGCASPKGSTTKERREFIMYMHDDALNDLYEKRPKAEAEIAEAPGYAVFSNVGGSLLVLGAGQGYGVVMDNSTDQRTFMRMAKISVGFGVGLHDFRAVFIFQDPDTMKTFVEKGWQVSGAAQAAAKSSEKGAGVAAAGTPSSIKVYQFTRAGLKIRAGLPVSKYWPYKDLN
jgi:lipid-binding SYLF domain-containing protein